MKISLGKSGADFILKSVFCLTFSADSIIISLLLLIPKKGMLNYGKIFY